MPDILIRGMEMPGSCFGCPMIVLQGDGGTHCELTRTSSEIGKINDDCPLVKLPPHGDLIDIRTVLEIVMQYVPDDDGSCSKANADLWELLDAIENAPVVVPAERREE